MSAMCGRNVVAATQVVADPYRDGFLARVEVNESGNIAGQVLGVQAILECADLAHPLVGGKQISA